MDIGSVSTIITCPVASKMKELSKNPNLVKGLEIEDLVSRLDLSMDPSVSRRPSYDELYPAGWARNRLTEFIHREAVIKIMHWSASDDKKFDHWMIGLLTFVPFVPFYYLVRSDRVEKIQMKYIVILHEVLKLKTVSRSSQQQVLEAMMLISHTRHAFKITRHETDK
eukprot:TRINITY_DN37650_c0_g1_i1.p1 TRINITY_DN37650_c0_g1~~TRINITY_DN37650_c0_g1_i1.p1  ORF type:complete len:188 (+),score=31.30 TRINITY_DN37650_c0_g1_i1:66-566(+)